MNNKMLNWISHAFRHPTDINEPLTGMEITGMTFAGTMLSMLQVVISVFISYYYTNVVGINAAFVGVLLLVTRIADAFSDLGMGVLITKTRSKYGKARPWVIRMAFPLLLSVVAVFLIPKSWDISAKTIYACVTYFLMITIAITPSGIAGSVLGTTMTSNTQARQKNSLLGSLFVMIGCIAGTVATQQVTQHMGDTYEVWRMIAVIFGFLAFTGQVVQFLLTKERNASPVSTVNKSDSIKKSIPALIKNKYFIIMCCVGLFGSIDSAMAGSMIYYFKYVLNNTSLIGIISGATLVSSVIGIGLYPVMAKKISSKTLILAGIAIKIVTFAINTILPQNLTLYISFMVLRAFASAPLMVSGGVYLLNTIEYGEYKTGIRANSLIVTVSSVAGKIGSGIGGALIGLFLTIGGYVSTAATQPMSAQNMIVYIIFAVPLVAAAAQFVLLSFYNLDKKHDNIVQILKERDEITRSIAS